MPDTATVADSAAPAAPSRAALLLVLAGVLTAIATVRGFRRTRH